MLSIKQIGAGLHHGRRLLDVILVTISQELFRQLE